MWDIRIIIELIKCFEDIQFTEQIDGNRIGYIQDNDRTVQVSFLGDNVGRYIMLFYEVKNANNIEKVDTNLSERFINGRHIMDGNRVILYTIFPLLNETFVREQIKQGLSEMTNEDIQNLPNEYINELKDLSRIINNCFK